jgi:AraC-like DNA-binding protein
MTAEIKRMTSGPTVGAGYAKYLIEFVASRGASLDGLSERCKISVDDLADLDGRLPLERYQALLAASLELTGDPALALHFGEALARSALSLLGLIEVDGVAPGARFWLSDRATTMRHRVERLLIPILHTRESGIAQIARRLGMSRQTLYRRLKAEHVSYERVLDELRHRMALHYLNAQNASVNETAYLVGFSEPSAFSRAFKRWTGTSPSKRSP